MPNGKTHDMLTVVTGVIGIPVVWGLLPDHNLAATLTWCGAHIVSGIAFSPDLDLASTPYKRWGPLRIIWYPYRQLIGHRDWVSHSLVFGPLIRLGYFLLMSALLIWLFLTGLSQLIPISGARWSGAFWRSVGDLWTDHRATVVIFLIGFITGGAVHSIADWLSSSSEPNHRSLRKSWRKRRRRDDDEWGIW